MINDDKFYSACRNIVYHCECNVLILNVMGEYKAYLAPMVRLRTRECRYNEVIDAQDITVFVRTIENNFQRLNSQLLEERVQSVVKESFKFGTDDYIWLTKVKLNE